LSVSHGVALPSNHGTEVDIAHPSIAVRHELRSG
jgi:hypothetical protein